MTDPTQITPIFSIFCIDYRYDALTTEYFNAIGLQQRYFLSTVAGSTLPLGYKKYCLYNCGANSCGANSCGANSCCDSSTSSNSSSSYGSCGCCENCNYDGYNKCNCCEDCNCGNTPSNSCNPNNPDMKLLKDNLVKNLEISFTLQPITEVYMLNHQDCGAFKAFLACSGYPTTLGSNNQLEIQINLDILLYAREYIHRKFPKLTTFRLGLIDTNGTVADYDIMTNSWIIMYRGVGINPGGLWYGM